jgi:hypothetical protein
MAGAHFGLFVVFPDSPPKRACNRTRSCKVIPGISLCGSDATRKIRTPETLHITPLETGGGAWPDVQTRLTLPRLTDLGDRDLMREGRNRLRIPGVTDSPPATIRPDHTGTTKELSADRPGGPAMLAARDQATSRRRRFSWPPALHRRGPIHLVRIGMGEV